ncbi:MAG: hypothetical protein NT045_07000 [Candidatus Aureabacteria bacterium]|nr:hypothetical protein [Candidatus Auribacterota bacterium]
MRKVLYMGLIGAAAACAGFVFADAKQAETGLEKQLTQISAKLDTMLQNQAKLDTIITNQQEILQMLRIIRHR